MLRGNRRPRSNRPYRRNCPQRGYDVYIFIHNEYSRLVRDCTPDIDTIHAATAQAFPAWSEGDGLERVSAWRTLGFVYILYSI